MDNSKGGRLGRNMEIGGQYIFGNEKLGSGIHLSTRKRNIYYVNSGRNSIYEVLKKENFDIAYVSAYNCHTVTDQFFKLNIPVQYYEVGKHFELPFDLIARVEKDTHKHIGVLLQNYFYSDSLEDTIKKLKQLDNVTVIVDLTHSLLNKVAFDSADYYVGSIRKWFGSGDGGVIITDNEFRGFPDNDNEIVEGFSSVVQDQLLYLESQDSTIKDKYRKIMGDTNSLFEQKTIQKMSNAGKKIFDSVDVQYISDKRRENCQYLLDNINQFSFIEPAIKELKDGIVPLYLPVYIEERDKFQRWLFGKNIFLPVLWPRPNNVETINNGNAEYIYNHILCLSIDQRYNKNDMDYMLKCFEEYDKIIGK